jgi:hypothetical protein
MIKERTSVEIMKRAMALISSAQAESIAAGVAVAVLRRSGLAEDRLAQRLGVNPDELALMSSQLWAGRTFSEERDLRAGPEANAQKRGQVSRTLQADLARLKERRANGG